MNRHERRRMQSINRHTKKDRGLTWTGMSQEQAEAISDHTFAGEMMTCIMCDKQIKSDPHVNTDWRAVTIDGKTYYACTDHFPPDGASAAEFDAAYEPFIARANYLRTVGL